MITIENKYILGDSEDEVTEQYLYDLCPYFRILENINNNLTEIIKMNTMRDIYQNEEVFYNITSDLLRLLPYKYKDGKIILDEKSGVLLLSKIKEFIIGKYNKIVNFDSFDKTLSDIHKIRNKFIHVPHKISCAYSVGGTSIYSMGLYYGNQLLSVSTISLSAIVYYLNEIYEKLRQDALTLIKQNDEIDRHRWCEIFENFNFSDNKWNYTILPEYLILDF